ncbi:MAG: NRDE family protein [Gammaproteobacteria bacterium]|nr:NRDE family protein [Gammaproteobacteria bacterium]
MCLILFSYKSHPIYDLVLAANRDEFYDRPTAPASFWQDRPGVCAGRDLRHGGTWLGIDTRGRFAAISNYRDPESDRADAVSRGTVVSNFLLGSEEPLKFLRRLSHERCNYNDFNLILADRSRIWYYCNRNDKARPVSPGVYGLSNHLLDTPWPKVIDGKAALHKLLSKEKEVDPEKIFAILADRSIPDHDRLPNTGVGLEMERTLSPRFISSPHYGTRSSTVLLIDQCGNVTFIERSFDAQCNESQTIHYGFTITESSPLQRSSRMSAK